MATTNSELINIVKENARKYYTTGTQNLSDDVFDALVEQIKSETPDADIFTTGWGYKPGDENKVEHRYTEVGSLDKVKTLEELKIMFGNHDIHVSAKLDGMSVVLYYDHGVLERALTRGDGTYGIDITLKVLAIEPNLATIEDDFTGAIRGEIFMTPDSFASYLKKHPEAKNHRNSAIGIINSDEIDKTEYIYLSLMFYTVIAVKTGVLSGYSMVTESDVMDWIRDNFGAKHLVPYHIMSCMDLSDEVLEYLNQQFKLKANIDGLVITDYILPRNGQTKGFNYQQIAYKFQDEIKITKVKWVEWTQSKHGVYVPVVVIEPIELEGTTVKRASGYNAQWIIDMGIKENAMVAVRKSNMIIPQIIEVISC